MSLWILHAIMRLENLVHPKIWSMMGNMTRSLLVFNRMELWLHTKNYTTRTRIPSTQHFARAVSRPLINLQANLPWPSRYLDMSPCDFFSGDTCALGLQSLTTNPRSSEGDRCIRCHSERYTTKSGQHLLQTIICISTAKATLGRYSFQTLKKKMALYVLFINKRVFIYFEPLFYNSLTESRNEFCLTLYYTYYKSHCSC